MLIPIAIAIPFLFNFVKIDKTLPYASPCFGITIITAGYWIFEPIPIVITAFFPVFLLPLFSVSSASNVAAAMFSDTSLIFIGGFLFSIAMVRWNLHSRIALKTVLIFGLKPAILMLGITLVTFILGLFISNTATALTMVPNVIAVVEKLEEITCDANAIEPLSKALLLSVAFTSSIGGMAVITGTPPNLILAQTAISSFPDGPSIGFADFLFVGFPTAIVHLIFMYFFFMFIYIRKVKLPDTIEISSFQENYNKLGKMSPPEIVVMILFILLALLWLFRSDINFGGFVLHGWSNLIYGDEASKIRDGTVAICISMLLFIIKVPQPTVVEEIRNERAEIDLELRVHGKKPKREHSELEGDTEEDFNEEEEFSELSIRKPEEKKDWIPLLEWEYAQSKLPWTILFLFSGGFALSRGFSDSGLDVWIGSRLKGITNLPMFLLIFVVCCISTLMTNVIASNTACANILLPIVAAIAQQGGSIHPYLLMIPCAFSTSSCFIMPVATPPNLIAYSTGRLVMKDFIISGSVITVASLVIVALMSFLLVRPVFKAYQFPEWANATVSSY